MIKNVNVSKEEMMVDGVPETHIGPFTVSELTDMLQSGIVDVYRDDIYVARMVADDYREYSEMFGVSVEEAAYELLEQKKEELLSEYPGSSIQAIIGFVLSHRLYDAIS